MSHERRVKLFRNGRNQAVRIPKEFELPGTSVLMRKEGTRVILEPTEPESLIEYLDSLEPIDEKLPPIPDLPDDPVDI